MFKRLGRIKLLHCVCVCAVFSLMQCSEVHINASELITWDHQIKMIYSPLLAFAGSSGEWRRSEAAGARPG